MKRNIKIPLLFTLALIILWVRVIYACNITNGGPCHTATSNRYDITCPVTTTGWPSCDWKELVMTVTDTTGDGNRIISCGTADTGLDSTTTGQTTCSYDYDTHKCKSHHTLLCDPWYDGIEEDTGTSSSPATFCGASGNACPHPGP
jgi:hypothetical protein